MYTINISYYCPTTKKSNKQYKKIGKGLKCHFSGDNIQKANKQMKVCSASLIIRKVQVKATVKYHLVTIRMAADKTKAKRKMSSVGEDVEKLEPLFTVGGNVKSCRLRGKYHSGSSKTRAGSSKSCLWVCIQGI